jgi:hypothetical protein
MADIVQMADDMVAVTNSDTSTLSAFFGSVLSVPENLGYLAYDFIDTEHRRENENDKIRLMRLIKNGIVNRETVYDIVSTVIGEYISKLNDDQKEKLYWHIAAVPAGKLTANALIFSNMNKVLIARLTTRLLFGAAFGTVITIGSLQSKAVYTARSLMDRSPKIYWILKRKGDWDLLYFLVEEYTKPFEDALRLKSTDEAAFNVLVETYLIKLATQ